MTQGQRLAPCPRVQARAGAAKNLSGLMGLQPHWAHSGIFFRVYGFKSCFTEDHRIVCHEDEKSHDNSLISLMFIPAFDAAPLPAGKSAQFLPVV